MEARDNLDYFYLVTVLGVNGFGFVVIVICYAQIYFSLGKETRVAARNASSGEMTVAKKMALLVRIIEKLCYNLTFIFNSLYPFLLSPIRYLQTLHAGLQLLFLD